VAETQRARIEQRLRRRIRFLLHPAIVLYLIFGLIALTVDLLVTLRGKPDEIWFLSWVVIFAAALCWNVIARARAQKQLNRLMEGKCHKCGYDLRASPDRCPECGAESTVVTFSSRA
jgi:hypothetical protein